MNVVLAALVFIPLWLAMGFLQLRITHRLSVGARDYDEIFSSLRWVVAMVVLWPPTLILNCIMAFCLVLEREDEDPLPPSQLARKISGHKEDRDG